MGQTLRARRCCSVTAVHGTSPSGQPWTSGASCARWITGPSNWPGRGNWRKIGGSAGLEVGLSNGWAKVSGALAFEQQDRSDLEAFLTRHYSFI